MTIALFDEIFDTFSDSTVYFVMAGVGTVLFTLRLILMLAFGLDHDADFDVDVDADGGIAAHGGEFSFFSMLSILSFMMGAGWLGLACRMEWGMGPVQSALAASGFGFALMTLSSVAMYQMRKLNEPGRYDVNNCIGSIGRVYMKIPPKGQGRGQVQITVDGRQKTLSAVTEGDEEIESFTAVKAVGVQEGETLIVEKA
ncbi:MAG: hypothetical protein ACYTG6_02380 [Planctomycetota bacterium]|jgi:hypothetical protein